MDAGGEASAGADAASPTSEAIAAVQDVQCLTPSTDGDCDGLYGYADLGFGFFPLGLPSPTSPPKTPSPGGSIPSTSSSPPPRRTPPPKPHPEPEPQPKPTPQHQRSRSPSPLPAPKPTPRRQPPPRRASSGGCTSPPTTALYISELPWWTTDAEVEAAVAPHGALHDLHFFTNRDNGRALGSCRAVFLDPDAAASAAAALHGQAFHGRRCVASLSPPPALHRPDTVPPPRNPTRGRGVNTSDVPSSRGNAEPVLGDRPVLGPLPRPVAPHRRPRLSGGMIGGGVGFSGFPSMAPFNARMATGALKPSMAVAPHANPAFLAAQPMAMDGAGFWSGQGMIGGLWGGYQPWHFGGLMMPRLQHHQAQQHHQNWGYGQERGMRRERPGNWNEEWEIGNVRGRGYPRRSQSGHDGGDWSREHDLKEKGIYREHALENETEQERHRDDRDRHGGGDQRRYQEFTGHEGHERRERARSWSHSSDGDDDHHPRRKRC